jgi:hypothetical protein
LGQPAHNIMHFCIQPHLIILYPQLWLYFYLALIQIPPSPIPPLPTNPLSSASPRGITRDTSYFRVWFPPILSFISIAYGLQTEHQSYVLSTNPGEVQPLAFTVWYRTTGPFMTYQYLLEYSPTTLSPSISRQLQPKCQIFWIPRDEQEHHDNMISHWLPSGEGTNLYPLHQVLLSMFGVCYYASRRDIAGEFLFFRRFCFSCKAP